jgi:hypothetical protein
MCYKAAIASASGDDVTLAKSLIISLEDAATNWQQLKEKFLLNFQGFQAEFSTEEDFLSCT